MGINIRLEVRENVLWQITHPKLPATERQYGNARKGTGETDDTDDTDRSADLPVIRHPVRRNLVAGT